MQYPKPGLLALLVKCSANTKRLIPIRNSRLEIFKSGDQCRKVNISKDICFFKGGIKIDIEVDISFEASVTRAEECSIEGSEKCVVTCLEKCKIKATVECSIENVVEAKISGNVAVKITGKVAGKEES